MGTVEGTARLTLGAATHAAVPTESDRLSPIFVKMVQRARAAADMEPIRRRDRRSHIGFRLGHRFGERLLLGESGRDRHASNARENHYSTWCRLDR